MSYILDALKKAERDRLREDPKELDDFASSNWDPYQQTPTSNSTKYLVVAIGALLMLLGLIIYSGSLPQLSSEIPRAALAEKELLDIPGGLADEPRVEQALETEAPQQAVAELAPPVKKAPPQLRISGHMFIAEGSPSNRLFANQQTYRVGDKIDQDWTLVAIRLQGYEIAFADRIEVRPYR